MLECTKCWCISLQITQMERAGVGKNNQHSELSLDCERTICTCRFYIPHCIFFCVCLFWKARTFFQRAPPWKEQQTVSMSSPSQTFALWMNHDWDPGLSIPHTVRDGSRKNLHLRPAALLTAEKPPESFVATELCRKHTHLRTHRDQTGISCLPRQVLIKTAKPFFSSSPLPFSAEVRGLREKWKTREEKSEAIPSRPPSLLPRILYHLSTILNEAEHSQIFTS